MKQIICHRPSGLPHSVVPELQGLIADRIGIHHAFFLPVICYLYIFYYALAGSRPNSERTARH